MKGYYTSNGYYGYIDGEYRYFTSQSDYQNEMEENDWRRKPEGDPLEALRRDLWF